MYSSLCAKGNRRHYYGFMDSESHNGIYQGEENERCDPNNTTRDPLDLRIGKADEGTTYFAETNLLFDARGEGSRSNVLTSTHESASEYNGDIQDDRPMLRKGKHTELSCGVNTQLHGTWQQEDPQQAFDSDTSARRIRVLSEGEAIGDNSTVVVMPVEKAGRHRSISLPYCLDSERRRNKTFIDSGRTVVDNKLAQRGQNEVEREKHLQHDPNISFESPSSLQPLTLLQRHPYTRNAPTSFEGKVQRGFDSKFKTYIEYIQPKRYAKLEDRLNCSEGRPPYDDNYGIRVENDNSFQVNDESSQQRQQIPSPLSETHHLLIDHRRIRRNVDQDDINNISTTNYNTHFTECDDSHEYRQHNVVDTKISIGDISGPTTRYATGHRHFRKGHLRSMYNPYPNNARLSPVPEALPAAKHSISVDHELTSPEVNRERDNRRLISVEGGHMDEQSWRRERLKEDRIQKELNIYTAEVSASSLPTSSASYSTPLSIDTSEGASVQRKHQLTPPLSYPVLSSATAQRYSRDDANSTSSMPCLLHPNGRPALLQTVVQSNKEKGVQYFYPHRRLGGKNSSEDNIIEMRKGDFNSRVSPCGEDNLSRDTALERYDHNPTLNIRNSPLKPPISEIITQGVDELCSNSNKFFLLKRANGNSPTSPNKQTPPPIYDSQQLCYHQSSPNHSRTSLDSFAANHQMMHIKRIKHSSSPIPPEESEKIHHPHSSSVAQELFDHPYRRRIWTNTSSSQPDVTPVSSTNTMRHSPTMEQCQPPINRPAFNQHPSQRHYLSPTDIYHCPAKVSKPDLSDIRNHTQSIKTTREVSIPSSSPPPPPLPLPMKRKSYFLNRVLQQKFTHSNELRDSQLPQHQSLESHNIDNNRMDNHINGKSYYDIKSPSSLYGGSSLHIRSPTPPDEVETIVARDDIDGRLTNATILSSRIRKRTFPIDDDYNERGCEKIVRRNSDFVQIDPSDINSDGTNWRRSPEPPGATAKFLPLSLVSNDQEIRNITLPRQTKNILEHCPSRIPCQRPSSPSRTLCDNVGASFASYPLRHYKNHLQRRGVDDHLDGVDEIRSGVLPVPSQSSSISPPNSTACLENTAAMSSSIQSSEALRRSILLHYRQKSRIAAVAMAAAATSSLSNITTDSNQLLSPGSPPPLVDRSPNLHSPTLNGHTNRLSPLPLGGESIGVSDDQEKRGPGSVGSGQSDSGLGDTTTVGKGKRGRPRKHAPKIPLPPLYVFIRNMVHNRSYNPKIISWVNENVGVFKVNNTSDFARTWGSMKSNRSEEMNYEKMSRAMRYHYGNEKQGRKGHLAMVKEKRLVYRFGELAINWRSGEISLRDCQLHELCKDSLCLWTKE